MVVYRFTVFATTAYIDRRCLARISSTADERIPIRIRIGSSADVSSHSNREPESAWEGSTDVALSTDPDASALFLMDICKTGRYDIRVSYPNDSNGTSAARFEVYLVEGDWLDTGEAETMEATLLMTTIVDQSSGERRSTDDDGFISIGEVDVTVGREVGQVTVVVRISSAGAEYRAGEPTILMADAVKFEEVVE